MESRYCRICLTAVGVNISIHESVNKTATLLDVLHRICPPAFARNENQQWPTKICNECKGMIIAANELYELCMTSVECLTVLFPTFSANAPKEGLETDNDSKGFTNATNMSVHEKGIFDIYPTLFEETVEINEQMDALIYSAVFDDTENTTNDPVGDSLARTAVEQKKRTYIRRKPAVSKRIEANANVSDTTSCLVISEEIIKLDHTYSCEHSPSSDESEYGIEALPYTNVFSNEKSPPTESANHLCPFCERVITFSKHLDLIEHLETVHTDCIHSCDPCRMVFVALESFERHKKRHAKELHFFCTVCEKGFASSKARDRHVPVHKYSSLCEACGTTLPDYFELMDHIKTNHPNLNKPFACKICPSKFSSQSCLDHHLITHTENKRFGCDVCGKRFTSKSFLRYHKRFIHENLRPFKCDVCGKGFGYTASLKVHVQSHTGEKPYPCYFCKHEYRHFTDLKLHLRKHIGDKIYPCHLCEASFKLKNTLRDHYKEHSHGDSPWAERDFQFTLPYLLRLRYAGKSCEPTPVSE
ncbi:zinc finger protein 596-like [Anopheles bellator]|uniref:zinc finger protein 596-like n=1 Tax=Anopheles bellator TaxID=139047 RepID=UPI002649D61A|nr:zinc finger protein 596-like [Anopheles bellator]